MEDGLTETFVGSFNYVDQIEGVLDTTMLREDGEWKIDGIEIAYRMFTVPGTVNILIKNEGISCAKEDYEILWELRQSLAGWCKVL